VAAFGGLVNVGGSSSTSAGERSGERILGVLSIERLNEDFGRRKYRCAVGY
jgi:hypothetical protein